MADNSPKISLWLPTTPFLDSFWVADKPAAVDLQPTLRRLWRVTAVAERNLRMAFRQFLAQGYAALSQAFRFPFW